MPKRKIRESLLTPEQDEVLLAAMREALKHPGRVLSADEEREFLERRAHGWIERHEYTVIERRGKIMYREPGRRGADQPVPPFYMDMLKRQRDFDTDLAKVERALAFKYQRRLVRECKAADRATRIRELAKTITGYGSVKAIARKVGCSTETVRRALKNNAANGR